MKSKIIAFAFASCVLVSGCNLPIFDNNSKKIENISSSVVITPIEENPEKALDEIYKNIKIQGVEDGDYNFVVDVLGLTLDDFHDCYIKKTDGKYGVADVYMIEPATDKSDIVTRALSDFKDKRITEFKDYNIYNSLEIAQNSEIIRRGKFVILLMVEDVEGATEIIYQNIPQASKQ